MADYRNTETFTADITKDLQPQVMAGNESVIHDLTAILSAINGDVGPQIVDGLRSPDTTPQAMAALGQILNEQNAQQALFQISPLTRSQDYLAFRNPNVDFDTSLINTEAARSMLPQVGSTSELAQRLLEQSEAATAATFTRLAQAGMEDPAEASQTVEQFQAALRDLDKSEAEIDDFDPGHVVVSFSHPAMGGKTFLSAEGPVDAQGVWHPEIDALGLDTPAQSQVLGLLDRKVVKDALSQSGIRDMVPVTAPPQVQSTSRPQTPTFSVEELKADPRFQQLTPDEQRGVLEEYYERNVATGPDSELIKQDPARLANDRNEFAMGALIGAAVPAYQRNAYGGGKLVEAARSIPYVGRVAGQAADVVAQAGSALTGGFEGIVSPETTAVMRETFGQRTVPELVGRGAVDLGVGTALGMPVVGGVVLEGVRGGATKAYQGAPLLPTAGSLKQDVMPFTSPRESIVGTTVADTLQTALIGKALAYAVPAAVVTAAAVGKGIGAVGKAAVRKVVPAGAREAGRTLMTNAVQRVFKRGFSIGNERLVAEHVSAASPLPISMQMAQQVLSESPNVTILGKGATKILMKTGDEVTPDEFFTRQKLTAAAREADPKYTAGFIQGGLVDVAEVQGTQTAVNKFFEKAGAGLTIDTTEGVAAAQGVKLKQIGAYWNVIEEEGAKIREFNTKGEALDYMSKNLKAPPTEVATNAIRQITSTGENGYYLTFTEMKMNEFVEKFTGSAPLSPEFMDVTANTLARYTPMPRRLMDIQQSTGLPTYTHLYQKMEPAILESHKWTAPFLERADAILKRQKIGTKVFNQAPTIQQPPSERSMGYVAILSEQPGSPQWNKLLKDYKLDDDVAKDTRQLYLDLFERAGLDGEEYLTKMLPRLKRWGSAEKAYPNVNALPKTMTFFWDAVEDGTLPLAQRETDSRSLLLATINKLGFKLHVSKAWDESVSLVNAMGKWPQAQASGYAYLRAAQGWDEQQDKLFLDSLGTMFLQWQYGRDIPPAVKSQAARELINNINTDTASAFFAGRVSAGVKQLTSLGTQVMPTLGEKYTLKAMVTKSKEWDDLFEASGAGMERPYLAEGAKNMMGGGSMRRADRFVRKTSAVGYGMAFRDHFPRYQAALKAYEAGKPPPVTPQLTVPGKPMNIPPAGTLQSRYPVGAKVSYNDPVAPGGRAVGDVIGHPKPVPAVGEPELLPGYIRMYHGGTPGKGKVRLTPNLDEARQAASTPDPKQYPWQHQTSSPGPITVENRPMWFSEAGKNFHMATEDVRTVGAKVALKNPVVESKLKPTDYQRIAEQWTKNGGDPAEVQEWLRYGVSGSGDQWFTMPPGLAKALTDLGYDGVVVDQSLKAKWTIALDPKKQVKLSDSPGSGNVQYFDIPDTAKMLSKVDDTGNLDAPASVMKLAKPMPTPRPAGPDTITIRTPKGTKAEVQVDVRNAKVESRPYGGSIELAPDAPLEVIDTGRPALDEAWIEFARKSKIQYLHPQVQGEIRRQIEAGSPMEALLTTMREGSHELNFVYSPQNRPPVLNSVYGRLFGQFGVYPINYAHWLPKLATGGYSFPDRAARMVRWGANGAITKGVLAATFGADAANYIWLSPAWYAGGPRASTVADFPEDVKRQGLVGAAAGAVGDVASQQIPFSSAAKDVWKILEKPEDAPRILITGMPPTKPPKKERR